MRATHSRPPFIAAVKTSLLFLRRWLIHVLFCVSIAARPLLRQLPTWRTLTQRVSAMRTMLNGRLVRVRIRADTTILRKVTAASTHRGCIAVTNRRARELRWLRDCRMTWTRRRYCKRCRDWTGDARRKAKTQADAQRRSSRSRRDLCPELAWRQSHPLGRCALHRYTSAADRPALPRICRPAPLDYAEQAIDRRFGLWAARMRCSRWIELPRRDRVAALAHCRCRRTSRAATVDLFSLALRTTFLVALPPGTPARTGIAAVALSAPARRGTNETPAWLRSDGAAKFARRIRLLYRSRFTLTCIRRQRVSNRRAEWSR